MGSINLCRFFMFKKLFVQRQGKKTLLARFTRPAKVVKMIDCKTSPFIFRLVSNRKTKYRQKNIDGFGWSSCRSPQKNLFIVLENIGASGSIAY